MSFALALLVFTCGAFGAIIYNLRRAPIAFEDESGFHFSSSGATLSARESNLPSAAGADLRAALFKAHSKSKSARLRETSDSIVIPRVREAH